MKSWVFAALVLGVGFGVTRLPALQLQGVATDIDLYARYATEVQVASRNSESFYSVHRRRIEEQMQQSTPEQAATLAEYRTVEYPPVAVSLMALPGWFVELSVEDERQPQYVRAYTWMMASFDLGVLMLVVFLVRRLFPAASLAEQLERCGVYLVCALPLYGVLYTRLDMGVALLVTASLALLVCRVHWCWSFAVLALAIHFKLMPAVLAPLWILASLPTAIFCGPRRQLIREVALRLAVLTTFGLAILIPYYLRSGPAALEFVGYHSERGIEIESTWATLLLPLKWFGADWAVYHSHGSFNVRSPLSPLFSTLVTPVLAVLIVVTTALYFAVIRRSASHDENRDSPMTVAQRWPRVVAGFALLLLLISIVANKVFSPQYLLWILPLVPLVDFGLKGRRAFFAATFVVCFLTMRIFPDCFFDEIIAIGSGTGEPRVFDGPSPYGAFLLLARNALCVLVTVVLAGIFVRRWRRTDLPKFDELDGVKTGRTLTFAALRVAAKQMR